MSIAGMFDSLWQGKDRRADILTASATLTNAQVKALQTTPIAVVADPGAGYRIAVIRWFLDVNTAAGAYTNISDGGNIALVVAGNSSFGQVVVQDVIGGITGVADLLGSATRRCQSLGAEYEDALTNWGTLTYSLATATYEHSAVSIFAFNSGGDYTGGNAANSLRVTVAYLKLSTL